MDVVSIQKFFEDMAPEERESYVNAAKNAVVVKSESTCTHDWGNIEDDWNGVYKCKKCGKYSA